MLKEIQKKIYPRNLQHFLFFIFYLSKKKIKIMIEIRSELKLKDDYISSVSCSPEFITSARHKKGHLGEEDGTKSSVIAS